MIGKVCTSITPFYDTKTHNQKLKARPVLIIGVADSSDYNILPISRVTNSNNIDPIYDIPVEPKEYPLLNLTDKSYIRTHKQTFVNNTSIDHRNMGDLKTDYEELYLKVLTKLEQYNKSLLSNAL